MDSDVVTTNWYTVLRDHYSNAKTLTADDTKRWLAEIQNGLCPKRTTREELCNAIRWAAINVERGNDPGSPSVIDLMKWVRRYRWHVANEERSDDEKLIHMDNMEPGVKQECLSVIREWNQRHRGSTRPQDVDSDYRPLLHGERMLPTDETLQNGEWVPLGDLALDSQGRHRSAQVNAMTNLRRRKDGEE